MTSVLGARTVDRQRCRPRGLLVRAATVALASVLFAASGCCLSSRGPRFPSAGFGQPSTLSGRTGVAVGNLLVRVDQTKGGGTLRTKVVVRERMGTGQEKVLAPSELPAIVWHHEIRLVRLEADSVTVTVHEVPCTDDELLQIESNVRVPTPCTPIVGRDWYGVAIRAPRTVTFPPPTPPGEEGPGRRDIPRVIIAGRYTIDPRVDRDITHGQWDEGPTIVLVNTKTGSRTERTVRDIEREFEYTVLGANVSYEPDPTDRDEPGGGAGTTSGGMVHTAAGSYFNADIGQYLERPQEPTDYTCFATLGRYRSNEVRFTVQ